MFKNTSLITKLFASVILGIALVLTPVVANAQGAGCTTNNGQPGVRVSIAINGQNCIPIGNTFQTNAIFVMLVSFLQFVFIGTGFGVVGGIVYGGYLYITARANSAQTERGRNVILGSVVALLAYIFLAAILNFVIGRNVFT